MPDDTVVVNGGGNSAGTMLLAIVVLIVVLALGWYFLIGPGAGPKNGNPNDINVQVQIPTSVP
jgi:hypothetical protein